MCPIILPNSDNFHENSDNLNRIIRKDLIKQLNFTQINVPNLEDRIEDFDDILQIFIKQSSEKRNLKTQYLSNDLIKILKEANIFSNFSQLEKFIDWLVVMFEKQNLKVISKEIFEKLIIKTFNNKNFFEKADDKLFNLKIKDAGIVLKKIFNIQLKKI